MANVIHHSKNKGCTIFLNEEEKEQIRALLGSISIDDKSLDDLWKKIVPGCEGKFYAIDKRTEFGVALTIIKNNKGLK